MPGHSGSHAARAQDGPAVLAAVQMDAAVQNVKRISSGCSEAAVVMAKWCGAQKACNRGPVPSFYYVMEPNQIVLEAIARQKCITAIYNRQTVKLAPHVLWMRHEAVFVDAVALERDGKPPKEYKLGSYKLDGLKDLAAHEQSFLPANSYKSSDPKYADSKLFALEPLRV